MITEISITPLVLKLPELISFYYQIEGNGAGGYLHIMLDDGNVDWDSLNFCREQATNERDSLGILICDLLEHLTEEERLKMYEGNWKYEKDKLYPIRFKEQ